jgi:rhodanese-related sulfurtransferase
VDRFSFNAGLVKAHPPPGGFLSVSRGGDSNNQKAEFERKENIMATQLKKNDPEKARQYFANKMAFTTGPVELASNLKEGTDLTVIDVRASEDYNKGHIPGAINLPYEKWNTWEGLRKDALNVLYCYSAVCHLAATAAVEFASQGYPVMEMDGGFEAWKDNDQEIETGVSGAKTAGKRRVAVPV